MRAPAAFSLVLFLILILFLLNALVPQMVQSFIDLRNQLP